MKMSDDPRENPIPEINFERIQAFALDLAYGVKVDDWIPTFLVQRNDIGQENWRVEGHNNYEISFNFYLNNKWGADRSHPSAASLQVFEYLSLQGTEQHPSVHVRHFILTPKAMSLLEKPSTLPQVFISYKHSE